MARPQLDEFLSNRNQLAVKFSSASLGGLLKKRFTIPTGSTGLALFPDGAISLFPEGREVTGKFELTLAKNADIQIRLLVPDLRAKDGLPVNATVTLAARIQTKQADLFKDFLRSIFTFPGTLTSADLKAYTMPELKKSLAPFVEKNDAGEMHKRDRFADLEEHLSPELERFFFGTGVRFLKIVEASFLSLEFEKAAAARARKEAAKKESAEKEKRRQDQMEKLGKVFEDKELREVLDKIPDERMKGILYAKLMEDASVDLTSEEVLSQLAGAGDEVIESLYKAMGGMLNQAPAIDSDKLTTQNAEMIYAALGRKVIEINPAEPNGEVRTWKFGEPLRSVRMVTGESGDVLLAGSKRFVYLARLDEEDGRVIHEFPMPEGKTPRGGVNAIALGHGALFASHSEYGLVQWNPDEPGVPGRVVYEDITSDHRTTRAAYVHDERLYFASGPSVFAAPVGNGEPPARFITDTESSITGLFVAGDRVFAGTENGTIYHWKVDEPENPKVLVRRKDSILTLKVARICSIPHLVYSARDLSVRARVIGQNLETAYESGGATIGVVDAASDVIAAADGTGRRIFLWKANSPTQPAVEIDAREHSEKPVLDLWIKKGQDPS